MDAPALHFHGRKFPRQGLNPFRLAASRQATFPKGTAELPQSKPDGFAKGPISEGAVAVGDWGSFIPRRAALSQKAALHLPFSVTTPLVKKMNGKIRRFSRSSNIKIIIPLSMRSNDDDRRQWRKQGGVVGAAASKTRVPPKARCGCWVPQPVSGAH